MIELFETEGCHLCVEAHALVSQFLKKSRQSYKLTRVEIASSDDLLNRYGIRIPVVKRIDTNAELGWPFDERALERFLE
jgi:hypothetical protein